MVVYCNIELPTVGPEPPEVLDALSDILANFEKNIFKFFYFTRHKISRRKISLTTFFFLISHYLYSCIVFNARRCYSAKLISILYAKRNLFPSYMRKEDKKIILYLSWTVVILCTQLLSLYEFANVLNENLALFISIIIPQFLYAPAVFCVALGRR